MIGPSSEFWLLRRSQSDEFGRLQWADIAWIEGLEKQVPSFDKQWLFW